MDNLTPEPSETDSLPSKSTSIHWGWKWLIVFIASIIGSVIGHYLNDRMSLTYIIAGVIPLFIPAVILAVPGRGMLGALVGIVVVVLMVYFNDYQDYLRREPERELHKSVEEFQKLQKRVQTDLKQVGHTNVKASEVRSLLEDISSKSKEIDPGAAGETDAMMAVTSDFLRHAEEIQDLWSTIATKDFLNPANVQTIVDIDYRLAYLSSLRERSQSVLDIYSDLDSRLKTEFAKRKLPPHEIDKLTTNYIQNVGMDRSIPVFRINIQCANVMIQQWKFLKAKFGSWSFRGQTMSFPERADQYYWDNIIGQVFGVLKQREALLLKMAAKP